MTMKPKITVIIPVWNSYVKYLQDYITNLLDQEVPLNIIVVDNCSDIKLPTLPSAVKILRLNKRVTVGGARNYGLAHTYTEYVSFHDVDDQVIDGTLQKLLGQLKLNGNLVLATAHTLKENEKGERWLRKLPFGAFLLCGYPTLFAWQQLNFNIVMTNGSTLIRTKYAKEAGGFGESNYGEDWLFSTALCMRGPIKINKWPGLIWVQHSDSLWHRAQTKQILMNNRQELRERVLNDTATPLIIKLAMPLIKKRQTARVNRLLNGQTFVTPSSSPTLSK